MMIGAEPPLLERNVRKAGTAAMHVKGLNLEREDQFGVDLHDIHLHIRSGEVVGIAGVSGNGQKELLYALSGEDCRAPRGSIHMGETDVSRMHPGARRKLGLPAGGRRARCSTHTQPGAQHVATTESTYEICWRLDSSQVAGRHAAAIIKAFNVKAGGPQSVAKSLSATCRNSLLAEIDAKPKLFIVSQPTWGVDVARRRIRGEILALRDAGCAVLVVSEELDELFEVCDRLHVIARQAVTLGADGGGHGGKIESG